MDDLQLSFRVSVADSKLGELLIDVLPIVASVGYAVDISHCIYLCGTTWRKGVTCDDGSLDRKGFLGATNDMMVCSLERQCKNLLGYSATEARAMRRIQPNRRDNTTQLIRATYRDDYLRARTLVALGAPLNLKNGDKETALMIASYNGNKDIVRMLLDCNANIDIVGGISDCSTALIFAFYGRHYDIVNLLLDYGASINNTFTEKDYRTVLMMAIEQGNKKIVSRLLEYGANVNFISSYDEEDDNIMRSSALMLASKHNHIEIVKLLLAYGADIDAVRTDGYTALMIVVLDGNENMTRLLLDYGASVNRRCYKDGLNALMIASKQGNKRIVSRLLEYDARDISKPYKTWKYEHGINIPYNKWRTYDGSTALILAIEYDHVEIVKLLLEYGSNVNAFRINGKTLLDMLIYFKMDNMVSILQNHLMDRSYPATIDGLREFEHLVTE